MIFYKCICSFSVSQLTNNKILSVCVLRVGLPGTSSDLHIGIHMHRNNIYIKQIEIIPEYLNAWMPTCEVVIQIQSGFVAFYCSQILHVFLGARPDILQPKIHLNLWLLVVPVFFWGVPYFLPSTGSSKHGSLENTHLDELSIQYGCLQSLLMTNMMISYVRSGLNSHYFHIIGDGHQPNNRVYIPIIRIPY